MPVNSWHGGDHRPRASADTRGNPPQPKRPHPQLCKSKARSSGACGLWPLVPTMSGPTFLPRCHGLWGNTGTATEAAVHGRGAMERILCQEEGGSPWVLALRGRPCPCVRTCLRFLASLPQSLSPTCARRELGGALPLLCSLTFHFIFSHGSCVSNTRTFSASL